MADFVLKQEYEVHYKGLILSTSEESYIITNKASYDGRQYSKWSNGIYVPGEGTQEGQSFAHVLVIPKMRVFSVVDPDATKNHGALLIEMKEHFVKFWQSGNGPREILHSVEATVKDENNKLVEQSRKPEDCKSLVADVLATFKEMSNEYKKLQPDDFVYAFHPFPGISVGHLHMHVFPKADKFRTVSTKRHDEKTIPLDVILEAEKESGN